MEIQKNSLSSSDCTLLIWRIFKILPESYSWDVFISWHFKIVLLKNTDMLKKFFFQNLTAFNISCQELILARNPKHSQSSPNFNHSRPYTPAVSTSQRILIANKKISRVGVCGTAAWAASWGVHIPARWCIRAQSESQLLCFWSNFALMCTLEGSLHGWGTWVAAPDPGDPDWAPRSWLQPGPARGGCGRLESELTDGKISCLPAFLIKWILKIKKLTTNFN